MPLMLLHAPSLAEGSIAITDLCFLAHLVLEGDWRWLGTRWLHVASLWWGWIVICSLPIPPLGRVVRIPSRKPSWSSGF